jgi:hypothetical protein
MSKCIHCGAQYRANDAPYQRRNCCVKHCVCVTCNTEFESPHKKKYCSIECNPNIRKWDKSERKCQTCHSIYKPRTRHQRYCSRACQPYGNGGRDKYYQTKHWKETRANFIASTTLINGIHLSNQYCIECYRRQNRLNDMYAVDHIVRRADGGLDEHMNLQSLCRYHHQSKSAVEGNKNRTTWGGRPKRGGVRMMSNAL